MRKFTKKQAHCCVLLAFIVKIYVLFFMLRVDKKWKVNKIL